MGSKQNGGKEQGSSNRREENLEVLSRLKTRKFGTLEGRATTQGKVGEDRSWKGVKARSKAIGSSTGSVAGRDGTREEGAKTRELTNRCCIGV